MAGYIGKSLAVGGTAVDAYSKTQGDARYLELAGGLMTGGIRQDVTAVTATSSATTNITAAMQVVLVTTSTYTATMQLPSASTVGGQVYRFIKVDSGGAGSGTSLTGRVRIVIAGDDRIGINANTAMELWFQDNYVDLMSDGSSRWIVMSTEMFVIPTDRRLTTWEPSGSNATTFANGTVNYGTADRVPVGTSEIDMFCICRWVGNVTYAEGVLLMRKNGDTATIDAAVRFASVQHTALANLSSISATSLFRIQVDGSRIFQYMWVGVGTSGKAFMNGRGYRLG